MGRQEVSAPGRGRRRSYVRFCAAQTRAICRRVAQGEALSAVCAEPGMPTHGSVMRWAKVYPRFGATLRRAREAAGWPHRTGPGPRFCDVTAMEIYVRLCEGEAMSHICADPRMPGHSTVYRWRAAEPGFAQAIALAREVQAERLCDRGLEWMEAATPETAYVTRVKLEHLRWSAGILAPKGYGRKKPTEAEPWWDEEDEEPAPAAPTEMVFRVRHFEKVIGADGRAYVRELEQEPGAAGAGAGAGGGG